MKRGIAPRLLLFDLDGTLVFSGGAGRRAFTRFVARFGIDGQVIKKYDFRGKTDPQILNECFKLAIGRNMKPAERDLFMRIYPRFLRQELKNGTAYRVIPGVKELLNKSQKTPGIFLALGTGNLEIGARLKLAASGFNKFFPVGGFSSDSPDRGKLIQMAKLKAQRHYGVRFRRENVFVIGDTPLDVAAARANGFRSVAVACGFGRSEELRLAKPDFYFEDYSNIEDWVRVFGGQQ